MNILMIPDISCKDDPKCWAIGKLAQDIIDNNPRFNFYQVGIHPREVVGGYMKIKDLMEKDKIKFDLIHFQYWNSAIQLLQMLPELKEIPSLLTHHNHHSLSKEDWSGFTMLNEMTNWGVDELLRNHKNVVKIPHGVDLSKFSYIKEYPPKEPAVGYVGRIAPWKHLKEICEASNRLGYKTIGCGYIDKPNYWQEIPKANLIFHGGMGRMNMLPDGFEVGMYRKMTVFVMYSTGEKESGCYDNKTEILTDNGWKLFRDLNKKEEVATLNPDTNQLEYQKPRLYVDDEKHSELYYYQNRALDFAVTPNHNMWIKSRIHGKYKPNYEFRRADKLGHFNKIQRTCEWKGKSSKSLDWFRLMGIYLAEGSVSGKSNLFIAAVKKNEKGDIRKLLKRMRWKFNERLDGFRLSVKDKSEFVEYLRKFGKSYQKFVPNEIKFASKKQINEFLDWYVKGDGRTQSGARIIWTSSKRMADDLQELFIKAGTHAIISKRDRRDEKRRWIVDHWANVNYEEYTIYERVKKNESYIQIRQLKKKKYDGRVYCVEVPNHILLVRRNGKPMFCGNTLPLLHAMARGVPVMATHQGMARDIIKDGENGIIFNEENFESKLKMVMEDKELREKLRKNAYKTIRNYSIERFARNYAKAYYKLLYKDKPIISIIIPTFNRSKQLIDSVLSVEEQNYQAKEIIVIDDGSIDDTKKVCDELKKQIQTPLLYLNTEDTYHYNLAKARNMGVVESLGDVLLFMDDRLKLGKGALEEIAKAENGYWYHGCKISKGKPSTKRSFIENFSWIKKKDFVRGGMFCERMDKYGGLSEITRIEYGEKLGFIYNNKAKAIETVKSGGRNNPDIWKAKDIINKLYY